jgi:hypothetical protein
MISITAKKHDNFSIEFKCGFNCKDDRARDDFSVNAWVFVPNSLDINPENYGKKQFYRDIKSNIRLITPVYLLREIADDASLPFTSLRGAMETVVSDPSTSNMDSYEYHLKMFSAIFKSSMRNHAMHIRNIKALEASAYLIEDYINLSLQAVKKFRELYRIIDVPTIPDKVRGYFRMCDEFIGHSLDVQTIRIIKKIESSPESKVLAALKAQLVGIVNDERKYKQSVDYDILNGEDKHDRKLVYHRGMLKKFVESELFIHLSKKKDGVAVEQLYYSIAAGVAMIFATAVAWIIQVKYGNITWPLFVALVVSYMMKDRIKDQMRYYFAHKLGNKYYDKKARVTIGKKFVGQIKEGFDFISLKNIPEPVRKRRERASFVEDESRIFDEKIMLYRKRLMIDDKALASVDNYPMSGINDIMRLHLNRFTHKMDNPKISIDTLDADGNLKSMSVRKTYYINIVFQLQHDGQVKYQHFRVVMSRDGVIQINEI